MAEIRETWESSASVVLERPANMRATTGSTGAPQPTTLQGPVDKPSTLAAAARLPPARPEPARQPRTPAERRSSQSATYTATSAAVNTKRTTSAPSTANPHSGWP